VGGHQRLKIIKARGDKNVDVSVVDLDEPKEKALNLALNKISGDWDLPGLKDLLEELDTGDFDMDITGFDAGEIEDLMTQFHDDGEDEGDEVPELPEEPETKPGDLLELGKHRVLCGDATVATDYEKLMSGAKADLLFTDPPYNVNYGANKKHPSWKNRNIRNDNLSDSDWLDFNREWLGNVLVNYKGGDVYIWGAPSPDGMAQRLLLVQMGFHWSATIIWKKQQLVLSPAKYQRMYEPCFYGWHNKSTFVADRKQVEVWEVDRPHDSKEHPTMKPVLLVQMGVRNSSKVGEIALDPFLGSGTTLIAAEKLGRVCYGMEIDPRYCDVIKKRYENYVEQG
jgi:DNA modification methylase